MILRPWSAVRLAVLALVCTLLPSSVHASLTGLGDVASPIPELSTALPRELPGPCAGELCGELEAPQPKTRVRGFELDLSCRLGGEQGLSCAPRRVYGIEYGERTSDRSVFTGHYFDTETQLYYAKARYFDPELGRFLSQDSYLGELTEPPSLHRYLYAADNPTRYVDPDGHDYMDPLERGCLPGQGCVPIGSSGTSAVVAEDAAKSFGGAVAGAGEVIAAPGLITYYGTGAFLHWATSWTGDQRYREQAQAWDSMIVGLSSALESPRALWAALSSGVSSQWLRMNEALDRGDAFTAARGGGNLLMQAAMVGEGSASLPKVGMTGQEALATSVGVVGSRGGAVALAGGNPGQLLGAGVYMASQQGGSRGGKARSQPTAQAAKPSPAKPAGPKPARGTAAGESWRYERYLAEGGTRSYEDWYRYSRGGRSGGPGHQAIQESLKARGLKTEVPFGNRAADAAGPGEIHQIGGLNLRGDPISRERLAIQDITEAPEYSGESIFFWDKNNPAAPPLVDPHLDPSWRPPLR